MDSWLSQTVNDLNPFAFYTFTVNQLYYLFIGLASVKIIFGLALVVFGKRALQTLTFTVGSMVFMLNAYVVYGGYQGETNVTRVAALVAVCLVSAIGGAFLFSLSFVPITSFIFGAYTSALFGLSILSLVPEVSPLASFLWTFSFAYFGGILILSCEDIFTVIGTSFIGSILLADGIDSLTYKSKLGEIILAESSYVLSFDPNLNVPSYDKPNGYWILFGSSMGLAVLGIILQFTLTAKSQALLDLIRTCYSRGQDLGTAHQTPIYEIEVQEKSDPDVVAQYRDVPEGNEIQYHIIKEEEVIHRIIY